MRIKLGARTFSGATISLPGLLWILDTKGRIEEGADVLSWLLELAPWWVWIGIAVIGICLILSERRIPHRGITIVVTPLVAVIITGVLFCAALAWFGYDWSRGPITWTYGDGPHPIYGMRGNYPARPIVQQFQMTGVNRSDSTISNVGAVMHSDATGRDYPAYFQVRGQYIRADATTGIPPHTNFMLIFPLTNDKTKFSDYKFDADTFLAQFAPMMVTVTFDGRGSPYVKRFTREDLQKPLDEFDQFLRERLLRDSAPGITPK